ncbi:hypothetical protein Sfum_3910 [Syntrophobacter fumaroxidans MPOB]|uniref:Uncharacterized protein n=1 Tax=Syntrophobacter fumaroxidans (strain DSM 10017 / MPOB) TaxID=335543 RepID=A0LQ77_SYNFM|nr:hypothetical protein Sfum_3910 [Syntrophobacter fumaroxidans MPOB]
MCLIIWSSYKMCHKLAGMNRSRSGHDRRGQTKNLLCEGFVIGHYSELSRDAYRGPAHSRNGTGAKPSHTGRFILSRRAGGRAFSAALCRRFGGRMAKGA